MSGPQAALLVLAGLGAGLAGSIAGLASLISYPALLAVGLTPVAANVTNTVALTLNAVGATLGSRVELHQQRSRLLRLGATGVAGGLLGAVLLLSTPSGSFELVVPWLVGLGSVAILLPIRAHPLGPQAGETPALLACVFAVSIYGGYFGAGAGILLLTVLLRFTSDTLARSNAVKNVTLGLANTVAAAAFVAFGPVRWSAVVPLAAGFLVGGRIGPMVVRHAPALLLRTLIALAGMGLAVHLGLAAYD